MAKLLYTYKHTVTSSKAELCNLLARYNNLLAKYIVVLLVTVASRILQVISTVLIVYVDMQQMNNIS